MLVAGCGILFWNEGRAVRTAAALEEVGCKYFYPLERNIYRAPQYLQGLRDVLVPETMDVVFDENNGALVVVRGALHIQVT